MRRFSVDRDKLNSRQASAFGQQSHVLTFHCVITFHLRVNPNVSYVSAAFLLSDVGPVSLPRKPRFLQQKGAGRAFGVRQG